MPPTITPHRTGASERDWVVTPYDPKAWRECLSVLGLAEKHAGLADAMESGFHIGDLAPIRNTVIHPNYPAAAEHADFIQAYVAKQVALGRMSGPYSHADVERVLGSPFVSSPLSVVPKANGKLRLVQDCSKEDADGLSVNGRIDADLFPTRWGSAAEVADLVRTSPRFARPHGPRRHTRAASRAMALRHAWVLGTRARNVYVPRPCQGPRTAESWGDAGAPAQRRRGAGRASSRAPPSTRAVGRDACAPQSHTPASRPPLTAARR